MSDDVVPSAPSWRALPRLRPWYTKLSAHRLAETEVAAPDGSLFLVRVISDAPVDGLSKIVGIPGNPLGTTAALVKANLKRYGQDRWTVEVLRPASTWRSERLLYAQPVGAAAILVDIAMAIADAIGRGDKLWPDDEDF